MSTPFLTVINASLFTVISPLDNMAHNQGDWRILYKQIEIGKELY